MTSNEIEEIKARLDAVNKFMTQLLAMHRTMLTNFSEVSLRILELERVAAEKTQAKGLADTVTVKRQELIEERMSEMERDMGVLHASMSTILKTTSVKKT